MFLSLPSVIVGVGQHFNQTSAKPKTIEAKIKEGRKRVKCFINIVAVEWKFSRPILTVWNTGETGDIYTFKKNCHSYPISQ